MAEPDGVAQIPQVEKVSSAYTQVADQLRRLIVRGEVRPGQRLPAEPELAAAFGVSRGTLREALRVVASQKLVTTRRGVQGGTFVSVPELGNLGDMLEANLGLLAAAEVVDVDSLVQVRAYIEVPTAGAVAASGTPEDMESLRRAIEAETVGTESGDVQAHRGFHLALLRAVENPLLEIISAPISSVLQSRMKRSVVPRERWEVVLAEHRAIYDAIREHRREDAERLMHDHLLALGELYKQIDLRAEPNL
ncbi:FadR/GntR family transcriptional regulator [Pseudonocardia sp. NPDC049635]|uniref:FadR/GntR family transcriptional regulator n=1 Tax=Pseudonocardia sp. NPDC049635 TaxID=3155506 RepID=UPI0033C04F72